MKQIILTTIPLLCAALAPLCADAQGMSADDKAAAEKQKQYMDEMNKITPSGEPAVTRYADPFITADFIYWKAQEDGLDYAFNGTTSLVSNAGKGRSRHPNFRYEPGFKVGAGLKFRHDGWDIFTQYTRLNVNRHHGHHSVSSSADGTSEAQSNITMPYGGDLVTFWTDSAKTRWSFNFNVIDLELGRNFWVSKWLTMRPFVGLKFDWTTQRFRTEYDGVSGNYIDDNVGGGLVTGSDVTMKMKQNQWAAGLRAGLNTTWYLWRHWCVFGELAVSGMANNFHSKRHDTVSTPAGIAWTQNNFSRRTNPLTAILEWSLGFRFETAFHNDDYMFQLQAGWEEQLWFNENQFPLFPNAGSGGNLSFQGLTVKAAFYF